MRTRRLRHLVSSYTIHHTANTVYSEGTGGYDVIGPVASDEPPRETNGTCVWTHGRVDVSGQWVVRSTSVVHQCIGVCAPSGLPCLPSGLLWRHSQHFCGSFSGLESNGIEGFQNWLFWQYIQAVAYQAKLTFVLLVFFQFEVTCHISVWQTAMHDSWKGRFTC